MAAKTTGAATTAAPAENLASADPVAAALSEPLDPRRVSTRKGSGSQRLSYLQAHDVKRTANRIFGWGGWSYYVEELVLLGEEPFTRNGKNGIRVGYRATVTVLAGGVQRGDSGYGDAMEYGGSKITPHELASKEAVSDALKRCLASFGDQFGLCLYGDDPAPPDAETHHSESGNASSGVMPAPVPMAPPRLFKEMGDKCLAAGFERDSLLEACAAEKKEHGGYRMSFVTGLLGQAERALASGEGEA